MFTNNGNCHNQIHQRMIKNIYNTKIEKNNNDNKNIIKYQNNNTNNNKNHKKEF